MDMRSLHTPSLDMWSRPATPAASIYGDRPGLNERGMSSQKSPTALLVEAHKRKSVWRRFSGGLLKLLGLRHRQDTVLRPILVGLPDVAFRLARSMSGLIPGLDVVADILDGIWNQIKETNAEEESLASLHEQIICILEDIQRVSETLHKKLSQYPPGSTERNLFEENMASTALQGRINNLKEGLLSVQRDVDSLLSEGFSYRLLQNKYISGRISEFANRMEQERAKFDLHNQANVEIMVHEMLSMIMADADVQILNRLPRANAGYRAFTHEQKNKYFEGTREKVLTELEDWAGASVLQENRTVFLLTGGAGFGKSTVAAEFARRLEMSNRLGATFFFSRETTTLNSGERFFTTIAYQLAYSQSSLRPHIVAAAREYVRYGGGGPQQLGFTFKTLLEQPLSKLPEEHPPIILIVDALDECQDYASDSVPELVELLVSYASKQPANKQRLRVLFTSRPVYYVTHTSITTRVRIYSLHTAVTPEEDKRDITHFITTQLSDHAALQQLCAADTTIIPRLAEYANGHFLYARTAVDFLLKMADLPQASENLRDQVQDILRSAEDVQPAFNEPFHRLYSVVLKNAFPPAELKRDKEWHKRVRQVLGYVAVIQDAPDGMSRRAFELLTGMDMKIWDPILHRLDGSVIFYGRDGKIRVMHRAFQDYLMTKALCSEEYVVDAGEVHAQLMITWLQRVSDDALTKLPSRLMSRTTSGDGGGIPKHFLYICDHWESHLILASPTADLKDTIVKMARSDASSSKSWTMWFQCSGKLVDRHTLEKVLEWIKKHIDAETMELIAEKYVTHGGKGITISEGAVSFTPMRQARNELFRQKLTYRKQMIEMIVLFDVENF